jgi:hypothetical protein
MNFKVTRATIKNFDKIRYLVEFEMNGQRMQIETTWNNGKCSFDDVIAHLGFSGETTVNTCAYCGRSFTDCEICPEFYYNPVKTKLIIDQLVTLLHDELKELPFDFDNPFINSNRGGKVAAIIEIAKKRGDKIAGIFDDYERYMVARSAAAPDHNDPELLEDDDWFFMKTTYKIVDVSKGNEEAVTGEVGIFESDYLYSYLVPEELIYRTNEFDELQNEWKKQMILATLSYADLQHRKNSALAFLHSMLQYNFPKDVLSRFLSDYITVDMLEDSTAIHNQFVVFMMEDG